MKIAYIYDAIYPWVKGGAEKRVYELSRRLAARGHEVHCYGIKWWDGKDVIEKDGVKLHGVCSAQVLYFNERRSIKVPIYFAIKILYPLMKENFDVIDCQQFPYFPCLSSKIYSITKNVPLIITWYEAWGNYWFKYLGILGIFGWIIERFVLMMPNAIIPISEKIQEDLASIGTSRDIMKVVPNGVDFITIENLSSDGAKIFDIIYVGRLISHKNLDILLRAVYLLKRKYPIISCCIIGDGPEKENLLRLCEDLDIKENVSFLGFIESDEAIYEYMHSSRIFILPSTREGFPNTILEANSCGLPVIIIKHENNAATGVIRNGYNGYILNLSSEEIADKVICLLEDVNLMAILNQNAKNFAKDFNWNIIIDKIEKVYEDVESCQAIE